MSLVVVDMSTGPRVVTLPSISSVPGRILTVKDNGSASATNIATLTPAAGDTYESGVATYLLYTPCAYVTFIGNATTLKWRVLDSSYPDIPISIPPTPPTPGTLGGVTGSLTNLTVSGLTSLGNSSNTGNLGVAGTTTLSGNATVSSNLLVSGLTTVGNVSASTINAYNINFTSSITSNGLPFTSGVSATSGFAQVTSLPIQSSRGICFDPSGNMYVNSSYSGTIYKITPQGVTSLLAGTYGVAGTNDGTGSGALFADSLQQMCYDSYTNCIVATNVTALRLISLTGVVTTIASGFGYITGVCSDGSGNFYVTELGLCVVKKVAITSVTPAANSGTVTTVAGTSGTGGYVNGTGLAAQFWNPYYIVINSTKTIAYIADANNHVIRQMTIPGYVVTTLAGAAAPTRTTGTTDSTTSTSVQFNYPLSMTIDANNNLYVGDYGNNSLRYINASPFYTLTLTGRDSTVNVAGVGANGKVYLPHAIALDIYGNPWVSTYVGSILNYNIQTGYLSIYYTPTTSLPRPGNIQNTAISTLVTTGVATETIFGSGFTSLNSGVTYTYPSGILMDSQNNLYVADRYKIRKVTPSGFVTSIYGDPSNSQNTMQLGRGATGQLNNIFQMCFDTSGNMYIVGIGQNVIYKLNLTTYVATAVNITGQVLTTPVAILYVNNKLYITNRGAGSYVVMVDLSTNVSTLIAGSTSASGSTNNATGTSATFNTITGSCFDSTRNFMIVCDTSNNTLRTINLTSPYAVANLSFSGTLASPVYIAIDSQYNLYVSNYTSPRGLVKIPYTGSYTSPNQTYGTAIMFPSSGGINYIEPQGVTIDSYNNIYITDATNRVIYTITPSGASSVYSGQAGVTGTQDSTYASSLTLLAPYVGIGKTNPQYPLDIGVVTNFNSNVNFSTNTRITTTSGFAQINLTLPSSRGICFDPSGNMYVNSSYLYTIYKITPQGQTSLLAGSYGLAGTTDGTGSAALFINSPQQICYDSYTGCIAMANATALRLISLTGVVTTIASGLATNYGVCSDGAGNFYITDDNRIKKVTISSPTPAANSGTVTTIAGGVASYINGDGATARFNAPYHIVINSSKTAVFVADIANNVIRQVNLASPFTVTTLAGAAPTGGPAAASGTADSTTSTSVSFTAPVSMAIDASNNIFVGDYGNNRVRYINVSPFYTLTIGGDGTTGALSGVGTNSKIYSPHGMTVDPYGGLWVVSYDNGSIYSYNSNTGYFNLLFQNTNTAPKPINIQNTALSTIVAPAIATGTLFGSGFTITNSNAENPGGATYQSPNGVLMDSQNNLYVCDNRRLRKITPSGLVTSVYGDVTNTQGTTQEGTAVEGVSNILYQSLCFDNSGNVYVSQFAGNSILRINLTTGVGTNLAITGQALNGPNGMLFNNNILYVINENKGGSGFTIYSSYVVAINLATNVSVIVAGSLTNTAIFNWAFSMCFDSTKTNIYVSNYSNGSGNIKIIANYANTGSYPITPTTFTTSGLAGLSILYITSDNLGNFYASGTYTGIPVTRGIIKITSAGVASSFCNTVTLSGATVNIGVPTGLAVDAYNNVYFADANRLFIGIITPGGSGSVYSGSNGVTGTQDSTYASSITLMAPFVGINNANPTATLHVTGTTIFQSLNSNINPFNVMFGNCNVITAENPSWGNCTLYLRSTSNSGQLGITSALGTAGNGAVGGLVNDSVIRNFNGGLCLAGGSGYGLRINNAGHGLFDGDLAVGGGFTGKFTTGAYMQSIDNQNRIFFTASGATSFCIPNNQSFFFQNNVNNVANINGISGTYNVMSDQRIKKNIVSTTDALDIINQINIVKYDYIYEERGSVKHGIIAQELQQVYPDAVDTIRNVIPSHLTVVDFDLEGSDRVLIKCSTPHDLIVNDTVKLDIGDTYSEKVILEVPSDTTFVVSAWDNFSATSSVTLYGKYVDDFLSYDKSQIGVLAAGACQTLSGQVSTLQLESSELSTITGQQVSTLQTEVQSQASTIAGLQATITTILEKYPV